MPLPNNDADDLTGLDDERLYAIMSYLTVLVFIPLLVKRDDPFVNFHAKQGLVILGGFIIALLANLWLPIVGNVLFLILLILNVIALVQALLGRRWKIPLIGTLAQRFSI